MMSKAIHLAALFAALAVPALASAATPQSQFLDNCSACHQATGKGVKGAFPALAGSPLVQGDPKIVITTVLNGRAGMPAFKDDLTDADLAAILTYVRGSWGNKALGHQARRGRGRPQRRQGRRQGARPAGSLAEA
jgi:cytochrome c6